MPDLQAILGGRTLTGVIQSVKPGLAEESLAGFMDMTGRTVEGDSGEYVKVEGSRKTARIAAYGSPSRRRSLSGVSNVPVKLIHSAENIEIKGHTLTNLMSPDGVRQRLGESEVGRQTRESGQLQRNLRVAATMSALGQGFIYADNDGNLLPSSSGASITVDFQVPAGNKNALDVLGTGAVIAASWATNTTDIPGHMATLKAQARKLNGFVPTRAYYGANVRKYILDNLACQQLINANPLLQNGFASGVIPDGFLGFRWRDAQDWFYVDDAGAVQSFVGADNIIFTPEPSAEWWEVLQGTTPVPRGMGAGQDANEVLADIEPVAGMFSYAYLTKDPVGITQVYGDTFLPVLKVPAAIYIADVTP